MSSRVDGCLRILSVIHQDLFLAIQSASKSKRFSDSNVVYKHQGTIQYGRIEQILYLESTGLYFIQIKPLLNIEYDFLIFDQRKFVNENIIYGSLKHEKYHVVPANDIVEKGFLFESEETTYFARLPNFYESS